MKGLIYFAILFIVYVYLYKYKSSFLDKAIPKHKWYAATFFIGYAIIYYLVTRETRFVNHVLQNIYDSSSQPLYSNHGSQSNADFYREHNGDIKSILLNKQAQRCYKCSNYILDLESDTKLSYKILPKYGGPNDPSNLVVVCATCSQFL